MRPIAILAAAGALAAGKAQAHAFQGGADGYAQFVEGAGVILTYPGILLPILALGVAISLWDTEGLPGVWPYALAGQVAGVFTASVVGVWVAAAFMALGVVIAAMAALWPANRRIVITVLAALTGVGAISAALEGHGLFELPLLIHLGILFGTNLVLAAASGAAALAMERVPAEWMRIGWRVVASWIGAILVLFLAFSLRVGVS